MPAEVFYYISKINKSSACAACLMLARGGCAVLKLKYKLHGRGNENGTAYTAIFFNGSTRGKYYKSLGSAAYNAANFKQAAAAAGAGTWHRTFCARA